MEGKGCGLVDRQQARVNECEGLEGGKSGKAESAVMKGIKGEDCSSM